MSRAKTIAITVGSLTAGALLATGVTGIAAAANSTPSPSASSPSGSAGTSQSTPQDRAKGGPLSSNGQDRGGHGGPGDGPGDHRGGMLGGPGGQALHGEIVVKAADGTISTVRLIDGTVTAVSSDSITVKAADDFTATYTVNATTDIHVGLRPGGPGHNAAGTSGSTAKPAASTIADVKVGNVARVEGTVSGSTATATEIHAMTAAEAAQLDALRKQHDAQRGAQAPAGGTTSSSSTSSSSSSAA
jgi:hypothetical protein